MARTIAYRDAGVTPAGAAGRASSCGVTVRVATGIVPRFARPVAPIARDAAIVAERIVERPALKPEILGLGLAHRVEQLEAPDIGLAPRGDEFDLRVEQFLLGIEHVEDGPRPDAVLGPRAFQRQLVGGDGDLVGGDRILRCLIGREGRPGIGDDRALGGDALLERLAFDRLGLADPRGGKAALVDRDAALDADAGRRSGRRQARVRGRADRVDVVGRSDRPERRQPAGALDPHVITAPHRPGA